MISTTAIVVTIKLVTGAFQYILNKIITDYKAVGLQDNSCVENGAKLDAPRKFGKSFFNTVVIFLSMLLVVLPFFLSELRKFNAARRVAGLPPAHPYNRRAYWLTFLPSILDVIAVAFSMAATKGIAAVATILLKSLRIPVSALMTKTILGKSQKPYQWAGVVVTLLGLVPVGFASQMRAGKDYDPVTIPLWLCLIFTVLGELLRGFRYVYEEKLIKTEKMSAEFVVFMESLIGFVVAIFMVLIAHLIPGNNCGRVENMHDTFAMLKNESALIALFASNFLLIGIHNYSTTLITKHLTSMHNMIISQARVIVAWLPSVAVHYIWKGRIKGEEIDYYTFFDFAGFVILALGAFVYNGSVKLPWERCYPAEQDISKEEVQSPSTTDLEAEKDEKPHVV